MKITLLTSSILFGVVLAAPVTRGVPIMDGTGNTGVVTLGHFYGRSLPATDGLRNTDIFGKIGDLSRPEMVIDL